MTDEIKNVALRHLATDGSALSLRAVAREMGMVSSALYRYFASRDELLTALILDAYDSLAEAAETADAAHPDRNDVVGRWLAVGHAIRDWAISRPHEYALIYGSPVPGYKAPDATIEPATRPTLVLGLILADAQKAGLLTGLDGDTPSGRLLEEIEQISALISPDIASAPFARGLVAWTELFGAINFELFGRLDNVIAERRDWFDWQLRSMASYIGLGERGSDFHSDQSATPGNVRW
jgi:AcrR family transcriptional regulator